MSNYYFKCLFLLLFVIGTLASAKPQSSTELLKKWNNQQLADTVRMQALYDLIWSEYLFYKPDSSYILAGILYMKAEESSNTHWKAVATNLQGMSSSFRGNYGKAIDYYHQSLELYKLVNLPKGIISTLNNIGLTNRELENWESAKEYLKESLKIASKYDFKEDIANAHNNLGTIYTKIDLIDSALFHFRLSAIISTDNNYSTTLSLAHREIGSIYHEKEKYDIALNFYNKSLTVLTSLDNKFGIAKTLALKAKTQLKIGDSNNGLMTALKAYSIADSLEFLEAKSLASNLLYSIYKEMGQVEKALYHFEVYQSLKDSLHNRSFQNKALQIEYEKKAIADSTKNAELQKVRDAQLKLQQSETEKQKQKGYFLYGILAIVILFGLFIFNRLRMTRKQKQIIEKQKAKVEEAHLLLEGKNKEILDSITYAKRLQQAILPPLKTVKQYLPQSFIYYQPKDIIAGDFYWLETTKNGTVYFAAADCTGHGVPGAMVSVVCSEALTKSLLEGNNTEPGPLLDKTRELVIDRFGKSEEQINDGMDIALCSYDRNSNKLQYSGANSPLWLIKKGATTVEEIKADKQPIGKFQNLEPYTTHSFSLDKGDVIYLFSDGFVDQFGGPKNKKFMSKNFKKLLVSIHEKSMNEQHQIIEKTFEEWKGKNEQIDDVCVIGFKV